MGSEVTARPGGAAMAGAANPLLKQWEPALIGKTQQDGGWLYSQEGQGKLSQHISDGHLLRYAIEKAFGGSHG